MSIIGNIIWLIFPGVLMALAWGLLGLLWSVTVIGLPVGLMCFRMARLSLAPFGKVIEHSSSIGAGLMNILWVVFGGVELALGYALAGVVLCVTVVGVPFGLQCFKLASLALFPFGARIQ